MFSPPDSFKDVSHGENNGAGGGDGGGDGSTANGVVGGVASQTIGGGGGEAG